VATRDHPPLANDRLLRALRRQPVDRVPVWIMRQAGRYLPEYRATRARAGSFLNLMRTPELACEVTLQPLARYPLDAAILFSDILTVPDAMGLGLHFVEGEGPRFARPVRTADDVARLAVPDIDRDLRYVTDAVALIRRELAGRVPLIGFSGSPWTLACYMVEGGGSEDFARIKRLALDEPALLARLLAVVTDAVVAYLAAQAAAGAQALMVFDTWGGVLPAAQYRSLSLAPLVRIAAGLKADPASARLPLVFFSKGVHQLEAIAASGCDAVGLDWTHDPVDARRRIGDRVALQGNLDPATLRAGSDAIRRAARECLDAFGPAPGHVFNLGHGITPDIDPGHLGLLIETIHEHSMAQRGPP
jgi:uroporphyrinogen decarboxylase